LIYGILDKKLLLSFFKLFQMKQANSVKPEWVEFGCCSTSPYLYLRPTYIRIGPTYLPTYLQYLLAYPIFLPIFLYLYLLYIPTYIYSTVLVPSHTLQHLPSYR
jgi:hypothetical protein